jgi:hypothetical protein
MADVDVKAPSSEDMKETIKRATAVSGEKDSWVWSGHPNTFKKIRDNEL